MGEGQFVRARRYPIKFLKNLRRQAKVFFSDDAPRHSRLRLFRWEIAGSVKQDIGINEGRGHISLHVSNGQHLSLSACGPASRTILPVASFVLNATPPL